jgi:hypothetical protein
MMKLTPSNLLSYLRTWLRAPSTLRKIEARLERLTFDVGCLRDEVAQGQSFPRDCEYQVFSQAGDDGLVQHLVRMVSIEHPVFIEFGVQNYIESNTRFLLLKDNWAGLVMDGSPEHINFIRQDPLYARHNLLAVCAFVTVSNINELLQQHLRTKSVGLLSIDIDGNDYWIWKAINCISPAIVITEYNFRFGPSRAVTVPYQDNFVRSQAHYSNIYYGASLKALWFLAQQKGYDLVCCNSYGNNAYWVRRDLRPKHLRALTAEEAYCPGKFREARDARGQLLFLSQEEEQKILQGLPLVEIEP